MTNAATQTNNIVATFDGVNSSSYLILDSGYKYMYDRFNNEFRYVPCNGDIAGLMVRTNREFFPWFSPAGQQRGVLNNATKLTYNPTQAQRDTLYTKRINPVVFRPGIGIMLFGDKTALSYASAFDRINVRRLFLTVEQALERAAQARFLNSMMRSPEQTLLTSSNLISAMFSPSVDFMTSWLSVTKLTTLPMSLTTTNSKLTFSSNPPSLSTSSR